MTDTNEIIYASAKSMAQAIQDREVSAVELVDAHLARIEAVNPALNAVVMLAAERARTEAAEADAALVRGESKGALHGVPFTLKDSIDTEGVITTGGTLGRKDFVPDADATVAARLRAAGGILLGKTNTPELTRRPRPPRRLRRIQSNSPQRSQLQLLCQLANRMCRAKRAILPLRFLQVLVR
jgi:amidase